MNNAINKKEEVLFEKNEIIAKIQSSKKCFGLLGTANFNINIATENIAEQNQSPLTLLQVLHSKFEKEKNYCIDIIVESLPQIAKISQKSFLNGFSGEALGSLMSHRSEYLDLVRKFFIEKKTTNIEPIEDEKRGELDKIFNKEFVENIIRELDFLNKNSDKNALKEIIKEFCVAVTNTIANSVRETEEYTELSARRAFKCLIKIEDSFNSILSNDIVTHFDNCQSVEDVFVAIKILSDTPYSYKVNINEENIQINQFKIKISFKDIISLFVETTLKNLYADKRTKKDYKQIRDNAAYKANNKREEVLSEFHKKTELKQRLHVKIFCDDIYFNVLRIDDEYFVINKINGTTYYSLIKENTTEEIAYYEKAMNDNNVAEKTKKGNKEEIVPCYISVKPEEGNAESCNRFCVGQRARDAFYYDKKETMQFVKNVAWALVFDRKGNILLQKRGMNAKDNQDMWDKSVGGHIGVDDPNVIYGARREIIEELYTVEGVEQSHVNSHSLLRKDPEKIIFLGYWDEKRYPAFKDYLKDGSSLKLEDDEFYCFKFECPLVVNMIKSRRKLPSGKELYANCFVDLFFVITSKDFEISELKNSKYLVLPPDKIKQYYSTGDLPADEKYGREAGRFDVTPDLEELLTDTVWDNEITKFAENVKLAFNK